VSRAQAWRRRAEEATGSRPVGPDSGVVDDIDALLADADPAEAPAPSSPSGEDEPRP
jgi:hypothetical protein